MGTSDFDERVARRYDAMFSAYNDLDDMTKDMLMTYCITCVQIDDLNAMVQEEGYFVEGPKGNPVEHPAVNTVHKLNADKARYFAPLKRHLSKQADEEADDELGSFLGA